MPNREVVGMRLLEPRIINKILSDDEFKKIKNHALELYLERISSEEKINYEDGFGRYSFSTTSILKEIHHGLLEKAREIFQSDTLLPTWSMMAAYSGNQGSLYKHKDDNACTYHLDLSIHQTKEWDLWVSHDGKDVPYTLYENDALAMYGEQQEHWRDPFVGSNEDVVINFFMFFCEPDHWYFTEGPDQIKVIRGETK